MFAVYRADIAPNVHCTEKALVPNSNPRSARESKPSAIKDISARSMKLPLFLRKPIQIPIFDIQSCSLYDEDHLIVETDFNIDFPHCSP